MKIDSTSYDALSEGDPIERGDIILVVRVEGKHLIVRKVSADHAQGQREVNREDQRSSTGESTESPSLESLGIDPFDDPLG